MVLLLSLEAISGLLRYLAPSRPCQCAISGKHSFCRPWNFTSRLIFVSVFRATCFIRNDRLEKCTLPLEQKMGDYCEFLILFDFVPQFRLKKQFRTHKAFPSPFCWGAELSYRISGYINGRPNINSLKRGLKSLVLFTLKPI